MAVFSGLVKGDIFEGLVAVLVDIANKFIRLKSARIDIGLVFVSHLE